MTVAPVAKSVFVSGGRQIRVSLLPTDHPLVSDSQPHGLKGKETFFHRIK